MVWWRELAVAALAALAVGGSSAPVTGQTLKIRPEIQQTSAEVELEPIPDPLPDSGPWRAQEADWATAEMAAPDEEVFVEDSYEGEYCEPGSAYTRRGVRGRVARARRDADALYERLRAPERTRSWTNRPLSFGGFVGGMFGTDLISGRVSQEPGTFVGGRLGWDFGESWGIEGRLGGVEMNLKPAVESVFLDKNELFLVDANLMYYPWGESRFRPFLTLGLGLQQTDFVDDTGYRVKDKLFSVPFGIGFKYRIDQRLAIRFDLQDNYAFAGGHDVDAMNNISIVGGMELRFGGRRKNYWPWDPSRTWW